MIKDLLAALARKGSDIHVIDIHGVPHAAVPHGVDLKMLDLEAHLPAPLAIKRDVTANDVRGLVDYVNKFKSPATQLYADGTNAPSIEARIDDCLPGQPSHGKHNVYFSCPLTPEWVTWTGCSKKTMAQMRFGEFLEENAVDIVKPEAATMVKLATEFRTVTITEFGSTVRPQSGHVELSYVEKDKSAKLAMPETFEIALPVFEGMQGRYQMRARLRFRAGKDESGKPSLVLWYELDRPDLVVRKAYDDLIAHVESKTGISVFRAS